MVRSDLSDEVRETLIKCLREHDDLFARSAADMPEIGPDTACHHLVVDLKAQWVAQRMRSQLDGKAQAAAKVVEDLIKADFVKDVKYTSWLSNVVLVKMANGKWRMCTRQIRSVDKLIDNSSGL